jgi:hypothetical protein
VAVVIFQRLGAVFFFRRCAAIRKRVTRYVHRRDAVSVGSVFSSRAYRVAPAWCIDQAKKSR